MSTSMVAKPKNNVSKISPDLLREMKKKDHKPVKGIFRCYEPRGGSMTFSFKKYKGDQILQFTMIDGDVHTIPLMVAKHLNQNCWYPRHSHVLDMNGNPSVELGKKVQRCSFESLEFQEENEPESE